MVSLKEVLTYPSFVAADAEVVAGAESLHNEVLWAHSSEMPEVARIFAGGELLLTQGRSLSTDPTWLKDWVSGLASAQIAGIAIELGPVHTSVPTSLAVYAERKGLPVISLRHPAYFMEMTAAIHTAVLNAGLQSFQQARAARERTFDMLMKGAGLQSFVDHVASTLSEPVVAANSNHQVIAFAPQSDELLPTLANWESHARIGHDYETPSRVPLEASPTSSPCLFQPIYYGGRLWGSVHVLGRKDRSATESLIIQDAIAALGLAFARDYETSPDGGVVSAAVHQLLHGQLSFFDARYKAQAFGLAPERPGYVLLVAPSKHPWDVETKNALVAADVQTLNHIAQRTRHLLRPACEGILSGAYESWVESIISGPSDSLYDALETLHATLLHEDIPVLVSISELRPANEWKVAASEAADNLQWALKTGARTPIITAAGGGIGRLMLSLAKTDLLEDLVEKELGPILNHDARSSATLLPTLRVYLDSGANKSVGARALHIERRTLYHRLSRIESLLRGSLDDAEYRLRLQIALRAHSMSK